MNLILDSLNFLGPCTLESLCIRVHAFCSSRFGIPFRLERYKILFFFVLSVLSIIYSSPSVNLVKSDTISQAQKKGVHSDFQWLFKMCFLMWYNLSKLPHYYGSCPSGQSSNEGHWIFCLLSPDLIISIHLLKFCSIIYYRGKIPQLVMMTKTRSLINVLKRWVNHYPSMKALPVKWVTTWKGREVVTL